jgi:hypothetical protein
VRFAALGVSSIAARAGADDDVDFVEKHGAILPRARQDAAAANRGG